MLLLGKIQLIYNNVNVVRYKKPAPPHGSGKHKYIFYLLEQKRILDKNNLGLENDNK